MNKTLIIGTILIAALIVAGAIVSINRPDSDVGTLTSDEVGTKIIDFINEELFQGTGTASLKDITKESGLYKMKILVNEQEVDSYATLDGKLFFPDVFNLEEILEMPAPAEQELTIGNFSVSNNGICQEEGKPIVYFFGSETCPHCSWEHPIVKEVMKGFTGEISFHDNMDVDRDMEIFAQYSAGGIPAIVLGCKYSRVGSGEVDGEEVEARNLKALTCKLTGSKPEDVCNELQDLINQIQ